MTTLTTNAPEAAVRRAGNQKTKRRRRFAIALFLGIPTAYIAFFLGGSIIRAIGLSFTNLALTGPQAAHPSGVGLGNYGKLFTSGEFWNSLRLSVEYLVGSAIIGQVGIGLLIAVFLRNVNGLVRNLLMAVLVLAWVVPEIVAAFIWSAYLSTPSGLANQMLHLVGLGPVSWLYKQPMLSLIIANFWRGTAFSVLIFGAALQAVPKTLNESATLDGAGPWQLLRYVQIPMIRTAVATVFALTTLYTLSDFTLIYVLTAGGPANASNVLPVYIYQQSFSFYELGYGTAASLVLLLFASILAYFYVRVGASDIK